LVEEAAVEEKVTAFDLNVALEKLTAEERKQILGKRVSTADGTYEFREVVTAHVGSDTVRRVEAVRLADDKTMYLGENSNVVNDYSDTGFLNIMYEDFLSAVQNFGSLLQLKRAGGDVGKLYDVNSTFEDYVRDALKRNKEQREIDLPAQRDSGRIDQRTYQNAKTVLEMTYDTMRRFLNGELKF